VLEVDGQYGVKRRAGKPGRNVEGSRPEELNVSPGFTQQVRISGRLIIAAYALFVILLLITS
jgi:hypothetical protein